MEMIQDIARYQERKLWLLREKSIRAAREDFWTYCKLDSPDFYKESRPHLKKICVTLQKFWEGKLRNPKTFKVYKKLMMNIPPRFGKSRTLTLFVSWVLGKAPENKIIAGSYNDDLAGDFSKYTRDKIDEERSNELETIYPDIFPYTRIREGTASAQKWALEGYHFTYKGVGQKGSATGKGGNILLIDDPVKDAETAFNEEALNKIWSWFVNTFYSRLEEGGKIILNMTRWAKGDPCGRLLGEWDTPKGREIAEPSQWYVLTMNVMDIDTGEMLCPELMSKESHDDKKRLMDETIFMANYYQKTIDKKGRLYSKFATYNPDDIADMQFERLLCYTDTADEGNDFLCAVIAGLKGDYLYMLDVYLTQDPMEVTERGLADQLYDTYSQYKTPMDIIVESNNGGRSFARDVERIMQERYPNVGGGIVFDWLHQSKNKRARILTNAPAVQNNLLMPIGWRDLWVDYYAMMTSYLRVGKNSFDDPEDATTGLVEMAFINNTEVRAIRGI